MNKIDFTNFVVIESYNKYRCEFDIDYVSKEQKIISYKDYYRRVLKDFSRVKENSDDIEKVRIITDIKRIIDCRCREILNKLGYIKNITKRNYPDLCKIPELSKADKLNDLSLISYLLGINLDIIFKSRKIRNVTEHEFIIPTIEDISESLSSCQLFLIVLRNMVSCEKFNYFEITSKDADEIIQIQPYKDKSDKYNKTIGVIDMNSKRYDSFSMEYSILLKYILSRNFGDIPRELFGVNPGMPNNKINCIGIMQADGDATYDELFFDSPIDYI